MFYDMFSDAFTCFAIVQQVRPPERQHYSFCFDRAMAYLGRSEVADRILEADQRLNGETYWYHVNMGHRAWLRGERDAADGHYLAARADATRDRVTPYHYNCGTLVWLSRAQAEALLAKAPNDQPERGWKWFQLPPGEAPAGALVVGFDPKYFVFFPKFLLSAVTAYEHSGTTTPFGVHCHVADAAQGHIEFLSHAALRIAKLRPEFRLSFSVGEAAARDAGYYTCLRFLALPGVFRLLRCSVIAMDVDSELLPAFFETWPQIAKHDLGLRMYSFDDSGRQIGGEPWSIGAHPTYVAYDLAGIRFANFVRDYIHAAYDPSLVTNWTIDQCALARGYDLLVRGRVGDKVFNFARGTCLYRLPNDYGGKQAYLDADPVTPASFFDRLAAR